MNKTLYVLFAALILAAVSVSAIESLNGLYKHRCEIVRPATDFRPEKSFGYIGIYGRMSDGSITCFIPSNRRTNPPTEEPTTTTTTVPVVEPICKDIKTCSEHCVMTKDWYKDCEWKHGRLECDWEWRWIKECHEDCTTKKVCE